MSSPLDAFVFAVIFVSIAALGLYGYYWIRQTPAPPLAPAATPAAAPAAYSPPGLGLLGLTATQSLIVGAIIDFGIMLILISLLSLRMHVAIGVPQMIVALLLAIPKYAWSLNLHRKYPGADIETIAVTPTGETTVAITQEVVSRRGNYVPPFQKGLVSLFGAVVPSGTDGKGLGPGYHWFPFGEPIYGLFKRQSVKEMTIFFKNMRVWTKNSETPGRGMIDCVADGIANFQIEDLARWNAVAHPKEVLNGIVLESARDMCEGKSVIGYLGTQNAELGDAILGQIKHTLLKSNDYIPGRLGVRPVSVNIERTDLKDDKVREGFSEVSRQEALAVARATDARARVARINDYVTQAHIDPARAAALEAVVVSEHPGATIGDQRNNLDVGDSLKSVVETLINRIFGAIRP